MRTVTRVTSMLVIVLWVFSCVGCATAGGERLYASPTWVEFRGSIGKVFLIVAGTVEDQHLASKDPAEIAAIATDVLQHIPNTAVVPAAQPAASYAAEPSDAQALAQARAQGADSVCVLSMIRYG